ncbi:MAG: hypothetical protein WA958_05750 [Tunicatimonas sp.]
MRHLLFVGTYVLLVAAAYAQEQPVSERPPAVTEKQIAYPDQILRQELDLQLSPVSSGKFAVDISARSRGFIFIKVYDVIGNLLHEEKVRVRGTFQQVIDLSGHASKFFVVEVGNEEFNLTKSIVAI